MENPTDDGAALPIHDLFSVAGDTPETDQLLECDQHKVDEDGAEYSAYRRMAEHAQAMERERNELRKSRDEYRKLAVDAVREIRGERDEARRLAKDACEMLDREGYQVNYPPMPWEDEDSSANAETEARHG